MNPLIQLKKQLRHLPSRWRCSLRTNATAKGVVPPPDGGYPNFTTAEGQNALFTLTSGAANTAVGWFSLKVIPPAASTLASAPEHYCSTRAMTIRRLGLRHSYSTPPASTTPLLERPPF